MEIKRLVDSSLVRSEEKLSDLTSVPHEEPQTLANVADSMESLAGSSSSFENLTASAGTHFLAEAIQPQPAGVGDAEIQNLKKQLEQLSTDKKGIESKIIDLSNQLMNLEMAQAQS